jgi:hypothetical protein
MIALRSRYAFATTLAILALNSPIANAANLTLLTDAPADAPLVITPQDTSHQLLVSVVNDTNVDPAAELMLSWQFQLRAIPDAGATGTLTPVAGTIPANYVFPDPSRRLGPSIFNLPEEPSTLFAGDIVFSLESSTQIPTVPGKNLMSISFADSADALGLFGVYAVDRPTLWADSSQSGGLRTFVNVPRDDGITRIADVLVTSVADYNRDGIVNTADYTVWRDSLDSTTNLAADGNGDGTIDAGDYNVWQAKFGESALSGAAGANTLAKAAAPEPPTLLLMAVGVLAVAMSQQLKSSPSRHPYIRVALRSRRFKTRFCLRPSETFAKVDREM